MSFQQFRFLDWEVYRDAKTLFSEIQSIVDRLPRTYRYDVGSQAIRAALSVVLNIAEGSGKSTKKDAARFFDIALGSLYETRAFIDILEGNFDAAITTEAKQQIVEKMESVARQLGGLKRRLST